jgi:putative ABC transport system substrate-binding protein
MVFAIFRPLLRLSPGSLGILLLLAGLCGRADPPAGEAAPARKPVSVAMVLWRGETEADTAFEEAMRTSPDYQVYLSVYDAGMDKNRLAALVQEIKSRKFDLIYTFGTIVTKTLADHIKDTPIIYNIVARPVESGIIASWQHSGNNLTGVSNLVPMTRAFQTLRSLMNMHIRKMGFIYNPDEPNAALQLKEAVAQQEKNDLTVIPLPIRSAKELPEVLTRIVGARLDAVLLPSDSLIVSNGTPIVGFFNSLGIPTIATIPDYVTSNRALVALGHNYAFLGKLAAENALEVLGGKHPSQVPSRTGPEVSYVINRRTAIRLGIELPRQILGLSTLVD